MELIEKIPLEGKACIQCQTNVNLTRHHVKKLSGEKTGEIQILCRRCHDSIERYSCLQVVYC